MWRRSVLALLVAVLLAAAGLPAPSAAADESAWWNPAWTCRRRVQVSDGIPGREPSDVGYVEFATQGRTEDDGRDVRVVDPDGKELPRFLLRQDEDRAVVLFPAKARTAYWVYFGNPKAGPAPAWDPHGGLVLDVRARPEGPADTWADMRRLLAVPTRGYGRMLASSVSWGFNPVGPSADVLLSFRGWISCPEDGEYEFAVNSWDASFLLVDGAVVAQWGGWHPPRGGERGSHAGRVTLLKGPHLVEIHNAVRDQGFGIAAGWRPPSERRLAPIPPQAWVGGFIGSVGPAETQGANPSADFTWAAVSDLGLDDREVTCVQFLARGPGAAWRWDFGDGTILDAKRGAAASPQHVYLANGTYTVRLDVALKDGTVRSAVNRVRVQPQRATWAGGMERRLVQYAQIVATYPPEKLAGPAQVEMGRICLDTGLRDEARAALACALAKGALDPSDPVHVDLARALCGLLREKRDLAGALAVCDRLLASAKADSPGWAGISVEKADLLLGDGRADASEMLLRTVADSTAKTDSVRLAKIRLGEALLLRGKRDDAAALLTEVESKSKRAYGDLDLTEGDHSVSFHGYLSRRDFDAAEKEVRSLLWEKPTIAETGLPRHLLGRLYEAQGRFEDAAAEYERAVRIGPEAAHAADSLLRLASMDSKLGRKDAARTALERCVREHPGTPESEEAKGRLEAMASVPGR